MDGRGYFLKENDMECSCEIDCDVGADGEWQRFESGMKKAIKQHKCGECHRTIQPGEMYERAGGLSDGTWFHHKTCADCLSIRNVFFTSYWYEMIIEHTRDNIMDWLGNVPEDCMVQLTASARNLVCEYIEEAWETYFDDDE
jgi:hypothetical protein